MTLHVGVVASTEHDGGAEQHTRRLYRGLADAHAVEGHLLGTMSGWSELGLPATDVGLGVKWTFAALGHALRSAPFERRRALRSIRAIHARTPFDVFHLQFKREQILLTRKLAKLAPVVWVEHGRLPRGARGRVVRLAYRWASRGVATVICVSSDTAADVHDVCGDRLRTVVIENAVDQDRFFPPSTADERAAARRELGLDPDGLVVGVVTRVHPHKRIHRAIEMMTPNSDYTLVVAGDGPDRARLESLAAGRPVSFLGWIEEPAIVHRAADAALMTFSSRGEGFPIAMVEAAASGCALVGFRGDALNAEIEQAGGLIVEEGESLDETDLFETLETRRHAASTWAGDHTFGPWVRRHFHVFAARD